MTKYEVISNHGSSIFYEFDDAVSCVVLLADYHPELDVRRRDVEHHLRTYGRYEAFPLEVAAFEDPGADHRGI